MTESRSANHNTSTLRPVEVNQRALIDKVLARYSGEFTVFRELLQNSDDAGATVVEIRFKSTVYRARRPVPEENATSTTLPALESTDVVQWSFRNNGRPFAQEDWKRLPKIAQGNPNPDKIGAFGVGFFSLFSVTDHPSVSSGGHGMQFFWKDEEDQEGSVSSERASSPWTTFKIPLRKPGPMPSALDFMRFLATSITFMTQLRNVDVFFDDHCIGHIRKSTGDSQLVEIPASLKRSSPLKIMTVTKIQRQPIRIEAQVIYDVYATGVEKSTLRDIFMHKDPPNMYHGQVDLVVFTARVDVKVDSEISADLFRATKKATPSQLDYGLIYTGKDEYDQSLVDHAGSSLKVRSIFDGLRSDLDRVSCSRIFIGHATAQTTGICGHMASPFIPTVERESMDLVDTQVATWNKELLYVGGFLTRAVYELELSGIRSIWEKEAEPNGTSSSSPSADLQDQLQRRFLHTLKFFTFQPSTPSPKVSEHLQAAFYECSTAPPRFLSSAGVCHSSDVKPFNSVFAKFLRLPTLSEDATREGARAIQSLPKQHRMTPITFRDIIENLRSHTLNNEQLVECLRWWISPLRDYPSSGIAELKGVISFTSVGGTPRQLSSMEYFINTRGLGMHLLLDGPLPPSLLPVGISNCLEPTELAKFGWQEFTVVDWLRHISHPDVAGANPDYDLAKSTRWAELVLRSLSSAWLSLSRDMQYSITEILVKRTCIPTSHGLRLPQDSYLPDSDFSLIDDLNLPIVQFSPGFEDILRGGLLEEIGVRKSIRTDLLLSRLTASADPRNHSNTSLIGYLVRNTRNERELSDLQTSQVFTKETPQKYAGSKPRYRADQLYPPVDIFRKLQLSVIEWDLKWENNSNEAQLLYNLGLRRYPPLTETIKNLCCSQAPTVRSIAFVYLCQNLSSIYSTYNHEDFREVAFIPAEGKDGTCLRTLEEVFSNDQWRVLGFHVVQRTYQKILASELGIRQHPPASMLLCLLETTPPPDPDTARRWFEILSEHISIFTQLQLTTISGLQIVPRNDPQGGEMFSPAKCYLGDDTRDSFYSQLFVFVNFGPQANRFLSACGSMYEPSVKDVAESLIHNPERFRRLAGGDERFLSELRDLAARSVRIPNDTLRRMRSEPILLGKRRMVGQAGWEHELRKPGEIVVVDDENTYQLFDDVLVIAPRDEFIERFYLSLGCRKLSNVVTERFDDSAEILESRASSDIKTLILERLPLFFQRCAQDKPKSSSLLNTENFRVRICERLHVSKTLTIGSDNPTRVQDVFATIRRVPQGWIELWVPNGEVDMYEVATALCWLLFGLAKVNDTLLLTTILSMKQEFLGRRGFNVDHISNQQTPSNSLATDLAWTSKIRAPTANVYSANPAPRGSVISLPVSPCPSTIPPPASQSPSGKVRSAFRRILGKPTTQIPHDLIQQNYIRDNVGKAIKACNGGLRSFDYHKHADMNRLLNNGYCDNSLAGKVRNLHSLGKIGDVEVHVAEGVPDIDTFRARKDESLTRFVQIIAPLARIYKLSMTLLHIFYDVSGMCIAFNRGGHIYLNLQYFEAWHDADVKVGNRKRALSSWFLTLAHEIAHTFTPLHNNEHEFWLSAVCEEHIIEFSRLIALPAGS